MIHPVFKDVVGHETILSVLTHAAKQPAPAYLFTGPDGVGKRLVAEKFTRLLLAHPQDIPLQGHPDFIRICLDEGARELTVKQARDLVTRMQLTAAHGQRKIALVEQADHWNEEAANALLKAIEEPSGHTTYLFIAEQPDRLPATIRSRTVTVAFQRVATSELKNWLLNEQKVDQATAEKTIQVAQGCPGRALRYLEDPTRWEDLQKMISTLLKTFRTNLLGKQIQELERVTKILESQNDTEGAWRELLQGIMHEMPALLIDSPDEAVAIAQGLCHAWQLAGSSLSPRLALEWAALKPYRMRDLSLPSFLTPSYL